MLALLLALLLPPAYAQDCSPTCPIVTDLSAVVNTPQTLVDQAWALSDQGKWKEAMVQAHKTAEDLRKDIKAGKLKKTEATPYLNTLSQIYELSKKIKAVQDLFDKKRYNSAMFEAHALAEKLRELMAANKLDKVHGQSMVQSLQTLHAQAQELRPATAHPFDAGAPVTSNYGWRTHPIYGDRRFHHGTDLGLARGSDVYATSSGTVEAANWISGYGRQMQVRLDDGSLVTYSHLLDYNDLAEGTRVNAGDVVGHVNASGIGTGDHLHLEVWNVDGERQNPRTWFNF